MYGYGSVNNSGNGRHGNNGPGLNLFPIKVATAVILGWWLLGIVIYCCGLSMLPIIGLALLFW